jgi:hypothetical protein
MRNPFGKYLKTIALALVCSMTMAGCWDDDDDDDDSNGNGNANATYTQVDRMGLPALNTVFNHPASLEPFSKTLYNQRTPATDSANYTAQFITVLGAVQNGNPAQTAALLLPDELPVNLGSDSTSLAQLNGRRLDEDAVDIALSLTVGDSLSQLRSANVDSNDKAFEPDFPYLASPH